MDNKQLKALLMAVLSPNGNTINLDNNNFKFLERNANEIMIRCGLDPEERKKETNNAG